MVNIDHIKTLRSVELRIILFLNLTESTLEISQENLAAKLNCNVRSIRDALRSLKERGLIVYNPSCLAKQKSKIILITE